MTTTSQPILPGGLLALEPPPGTEAVEILSPPPDKTDIVDAGQNVSFKINLQITGLGVLVNWYRSQPVTVKLHCQRVEDNQSVELGPFSFTTPATAAALNAGFSFTTAPPSTTGLNGAGATFETATGDQDGVYRVVTELHFTADNSNCLIDDRILIVTQSP